MGTVIPCSRTVDSLVVLPHAHGNVVDHLNSVVQLPYLGNERGDVVQQVPRICTGSEGILGVILPRKPEHKVHPVCIAHR